MANVIEFTIKGIDKGSSVLGKFSKTTAATVTHVTKLSAGVAGMSAAILGYVSIVNSSLDKQAKFATRIGQSVEELTRLQFAAEMASIPIEQFNMATQRMTRRVAEAAKGTGEATAALREMGIDAQSFTRLGLDDQMGILADKFSGMQDEAEQLRLAFKLFDSEGTAMLQMLKAGSPAMQQAAKDADYLGVVLSKQGAANAEKFSDEMTRVQSALKGLGMGISGELTPVITGLLNKFTDIVAQARPAMVAFVGETVQNVATVGVVIGQVWSKLQQFISNVFSKQGFQDFVDGAAEAMAWVIDLFLKSGPILAGAMVGVFYLMWESFAELGKWGLDKVFDVFTGNDIAGSISDVLFERIPQATADTRAAVGAMWDDLGALAITKGGGVTDAMVSMFGINVELAKEQAAEMVSSLEMFGTVADEQLATVSASQTSFLEAFYAKNAEFIAAQQETAVALAEQTHDIVMQTVDALSQGIASVIVEGGNLMTALKGIAQGVVQEMIAMLIKMGIQRLVTAAVSNSATAAQASAELSKGAATTYMNAFSSTAAIPVVGPGLAPGVAAAATAAATAGSTAAGAAGASLGQTLIAGARADGGPVGVGQTYLVGERGPELFTPRGNGTIVPNEQLGGGGGVVVENLSVHMFENATNADTLLQMPVEELREVVASKIIPALDSLARQGVRPQYLAG